MSINSTLYNDKFTPPEINILQKNSNIYYDSFLRIEENSKLKFNKQDTMKIFNISIDESLAKSQTENNILNQKKILNEILNSSYEVGYSISKMKSLKNKIKYLETAEA